MKRLNRPEPPEQLTKEFIETMVTEFIGTSKSVWNKDWIRTALEKMSAGKCAYCECRLDAGNYMEVEHFYCKKHHPSKVVS